MNRRNLLTLAGGAGLAALTGCGRAADGPGTGDLLTSRLPLPPRFRTPLPIPPTARPARITAAADHYVVTQRVADVNLLPDRTTRIWGFDGVFPGPTFRGRRGRPMVVTVRNELPVPTSTHLHGGVTPAESDGFPTDLITPGTSRWPSATVRSRRTGRCNTRCGTWRCPRRARRAASCPASSAT